MFRRGYIVSSTRYQWIAALCSIIPFLDELPAFFGRDKIRDAFGINSNSTATNTPNNTTISIKNYLIGKNFTVSKRHLKSGRFKYLRPSKKQQAMVNNAKDSNRYFQISEKCNSEYKIDEKLARPPTKSQIPSTNQNSRKTNSTLSMKYRNYTLSYHAISSIAAESELRNIIQN
ncbi:unnamed protein product [Rotaria magnacalcarata]|uniref:Uncharacterized protein n=2 Tax=Rotaria magnacalcarata TaxID=392030 RepID=A0A816C5J0_9BILA|nr:unnamed protein product [Rotaria magnacalcarata]CAF4749274.1 unnamed protein product [Rotaria magnacalcarata]